jgi:hypothetical protein
MFNVFISLPGVMKEPNPSVLTKVELGKPYEVHENGRMTVRKSESFRG